MTIVDIERTCSRLWDHPAAAGGSAGHDNADVGAASGPVSACREAPAFVLLGEPGAGKTTVLNRERTLTSERDGTPQAGARVLDARDFVTLDIGDPTEWRDRTLFIDGLDEIRSDDEDPRSPLDRVRARLQALGRPRFRLSCREADWLGSDDWQRLREIAPGGELVVLRLDPLGPDGAERIATGLLGSGAAAFLDQARRLGLARFLDNPQTLSLLASAAADGRWPDSRLQIFEGACRQLASERSPKQGYAMSGRAAPEQLLDPAGRTCALLLLSGAAGVTLPPATSDDVRNYPSPSILDPPGPSTTPGADPGSGGVHERLRTRLLALSSSLFADAGAGQVGRRIPMHGHIAEFLAGRYLAGLIDDGLPAARVIALMTGGDGGVVTSCRGLSAWLAAHSGSARAELIARDPVGVGLYGDIAAFLGCEKQALRRSLAHEGVRPESLGPWAEEAFGPLAAGPPGPAPQAQVQVQVQTQVQELHPLRQDTATPAEFAPDPGVAEAADEDHDDLQGVVDRADLPSPSEILALHAESRLHDLAVLFLASLRERTAADPHFIDTVDDEQKRRACAFHFAVPRMQAAHPDWYRRLLEQNTDLVAEVLVAIVRIELRQGRESVVGLLDLAHDPDHAALARVAAPPLLRAFPVRHASGKLHNLTRLLWAGLLHAERGELLAVIERKMTSQSMTVGQRVYWLAAGLIAAPDEYAEPLAAVVGKNDLQAWRLSDFLWSERPSLFHPALLPVHALETVLRMLSLVPAVGVPSPRRKGDDEGQAPWRPREIIDCLARSSAPEAGAALRRLADEEAFLAWRQVLREAADLQASLARDSHRPEPDFGQISATLGNLAPANAADLAALAVDRLDQMARRIRTTDANLRAEFWNLDDHGRPTSPGPANACRDAVLSHLLQVLPPEVDGSPAGQDAGGVGGAASARADMRLTCADFDLPVAIRRHSDPALWRAARDQLVGTYGDDPATGGHGILLVLWFGGPKKAPLDDSGTRAASPEELRTRLERVHAVQFTPGQLRKLTVRVVDVSWSDPASG